MMKELKCLQCMPLFRDMDVAKLKLLAIAGTRVTYEVGQPILHQGDDAVAVFIILEGQAEVHREVDGVVARLTTMGEGSIVGDFGCYLDQPYSATIVPVTPVTVLRVDKKDYLELIMQLPQFSLAVIRQLARTVISSGDRIAKTLTH